MSFVTLLALGLSLLVAVPTLAHLLRRGRAKEQPFPPAALVPEAKATTRERSRLEDRGLLLLRALMVLALAVLGAGPLVQCSRVALGRTGGLVARTPEPDPVLLKMRDAVSRYDETALRQGLQVLIPEFSPRPAFQENTATVVPFPAREAVRTR